MAEAVYLELESSSSRALTKMVSLGIFMTDDDVSSLSQKNRCLQASKPIDKSEKDGERTTKNSI